MRNIFIFLTYTGAVWWGIQIERYSDEARLTITSTLCSTLCNPYVPVNDESLRMTLEEPSEKLIAARLMYLARENVFQQLSYNFIHKDLSETFGQDMRPYIKLIKELIVRQIQMPYTSDDSCQHANNGWCDEKRYVTTKSVNIHPEECDTRTDYTDCYQYAIGNGIKYF
jgi:hypothetical protein